MSMFRIDLPTRRVGIAFSYPNVTVNIGRSDGGGHSQRSLRGARCKVFQVDLNEKGEEVSVSTIADAVAVCHSKDKFIREVGRTRSLTRALATLDYTNGHLGTSRVFSKAEREVIWSTWRNRPRPVTTPKSGAPSQEVVPSSQEAVA